MNLHYSGIPDLDPYQSEKSDTDPHQSEGQNTEIVKEAQPGGVEA